MDDRSTPWRGVAVFAAGAVTGAVLGRVLTPHVAQLTGFTRAKSGGGDAFDELTADHQRMIQAIGLALDARGPARMGALIAIKRDLGKHALAEEDVIYPLIRDVANAPADADRLNKEHGEIKTFLYEIEVALEQNDDAGYRAAMLKLRDEVSEHAKDEEIRQFPRLRELLDDTRRAKVTAQVDREKALIA